MRDLFEKSLVVIGGASGLGLSAARVFVEEGAQVVVAGRVRDAVERASRLLGPQAIAICADPCDPTTATRAVAQAVNAFGKLDGLYHAVGATGRKMGDGPLHELSDTAWRIVLNWNLNAAMYSNRAAIRQFLHQHTGGSILNLGSVCGLAASQGQFITHAYAVAESAVIGLSKSLAAYYADRSIRVNVLAPGFIEQPASARDSGLLEFDGEEATHFVQTKQPLDGGRFGKPGDYDAAAVYFMSDGSRFTTAQVLSVDGGWSVSEGQYDTG
ncbi:MAG: short-chain dehydrogenase [Chthoniobacteraceae bacterium]|nr:short-chain dehydrogenase [Chthoniobacteraceae bacterium]